MLSQDGRIEGIDISQFQDDYYTAKKPDLKQAAANGAKFYYMRSSYGQVEDRMFRHFLEQGRGVMDQAAYHYMDYYSYSSLGYNSTKWGVIQGEKIISLLKGNPMPIFIDVESASPSYAPNISKVWGTAMTILDNILKTVDDHFGVATGIYASTGWLKKFYGYHKWRPLWAANYNKVGPEVVRKLVADAGFTDLLIWQYASHGDIDGDGTGDGRDLGFESNGLDLNLWMQSKERYDEFFGAKPVEPPAVKPLDNYLLPIDEGKHYITQIFGVNPGTYPTSRGHNGIDFGLPVGCNLYASREGKVIQAGDFSQPGITDGKIGYGRHCRIEHSDGAITIYGHLSRLDVKVGDVVTAGQLIGLSGGATSDPHSGFSSGPHLHFEIRKEGAPQIPGGFVYNGIDPLPLFVPRKTENPLYTINVKIDTLLLRKGPGSNFGMLRNIAPGKHNVYEEINGWGRVSQLFGEWSYVAFSGWVDKLDAPLAIPEPTEPIIPAPKEIKMKSVEIKKVKQGRGGLRVRTSAKAPTLFSLVQDKLAEGTEVEILERVVSGNYIWVRIGYGQWVCEREGQTVYLE
ncbi:MAG: peptidoglycan DD-metalloendopeptidase family protein [Anaerolineaceae bacterium]